MTEDDTFRVLSRIPYREMRKHYYNLNDITWNQLTEKEVVEFFGKYGWTEYEFRAHKNI